MYVCHVPGIVLVPSGLLGHGGESDNREIKGIKKNQKARCRQDKKVGCQRE